MNTAEIQSLSDASFANNKDLSSQLGCIFLIMDIKGKCSKLSCSSTTCKRVTRSVLAGELHAFVHRYDARFTIAYTVGNILNKKIKIKVLTGSRTLFDSVILLCTMAEKRLLIDVFELRESYKNGEISRIVWINSKHKIANELKKQRTIARCMICFKKIHKNSHTTMNWKSTTSA